MSGFTVLTVVLVAYALIATKLDHWRITAPMVFVLAGAILGPAGLRMIPVALDSETTLTITELTLALVLFADASTVRLRDVEGDSALPTRLLFIGLPLTVIAGAVVARLAYPDVGWAAAFLVATILAPTDAALGLAVVTNRAVPVRIRRALNVESGLNDGIATPFVTLFIAVVAAEDGLSAKSWGVEALTQIGLAILAAVIVGLLGGWLFTVARERGWTSGISESLAVLALALLAYEASVSIGGNGFVAAFAGGLLFGAVTGGRAERSMQFTEGLGLCSSFFVWAVFGAIFVGEVLREDVSALPILYAVLSLTVIRLVPVAIAMIGTRLRGITIAFMGWFGPRGLASVVFTLIVIEELGADGSVHPLVVIATWTIFLSVLLHGFSATPLAARYGAAIGRSDPDIPELAPAQEPRIRLRDLAGRHHLEHVQGGAQPPSS